MKSGTTVLTVQGDVRSLLMAERVAVNFLQQLSGIATRSPPQFCAAVRGYPTRILDTARLTPGLRARKVWAVGGGKNHRFSLATVCSSRTTTSPFCVQTSIDVAGACRPRASGTPHGLRIEVEAKTMQEVKEALAGKADIILLDNMSPAQVRRPWHSSNNAPWSKCLVE